MKTHIIKLGSIAIQEKVIVTPNSVEASIRPYLGLDQIESQTGKIISYDSSSTEGKSTAFAFNNSHVLYGKLRPYLNKVALPERDGRCSTEIIPLLPCGVDREFLAFLLRHEDIVNVAMSERTGSRMPRANMDVLLNFEVEIPKSIIDQRQIAAKLKAQLAEVETARKALQVQLSDITQLERLYTKQFENRLFATAIKKPFSDFVLSYKNGYGIRPKEGEKGVIVLRIADVSKGFIDLSSIRQGDISEKEAKTYKLEAGDLIFIRVNGTKGIVGKCILVNKIPDNTIFNDHLIRVKLNDTILPEYAQLCASLPNSRQMIEEAASTSAGQLTVNQKILDSITIAFVDRNIQCTMINEYRAVFSEIDLLKNSVKNQLKELNLIPARLLAQAFNL